jgi:beta-glucanase (GH16 family)
MEIKLAQYTEKKQGVEISKNLGFCGIISTNLYKIQYKEQGINWYFIMDMQL